MRLVTVCEVWLRFPPRVEHSKKNPCEYHNTIFKDNILVFLCQTLEEN